MIRVLQFQDAQGLQNFLQGPIPTGPQAEPGLGNDKSNVIEIYFDSASSMHTVVYDEVMS